MRAFDRVGRRRERARRSARVNLGLCLEGLEDRKLMSGSTTSLNFTQGVAFEFGPASAPVGTGAVGVSTQAYSSTTGYGWTNGVGLDTRDRGAPDSIANDFVTGSDGTFLVDVPNGTYTVTATLGDASAPHGPVTIWCRGSRLIRSRR